MEPFRRPFAVFSIFVASTSFISGCETTSSPAQNFDVAALVGKSLAEVEATLGPPDRDGRPSQTEKWSGLTTGQKIWNRAAVQLIVRYRLRDRWITEFVVRYTDRRMRKDAGHKEELLALGNLRANASNYRVRYLAHVGAPGLYYGVSIIPSQRSTHLNMSRTLS